MAEGSWPAGTAGDVAQILRDGRDHTRADLARATQMSRSTVAQRIDELLRLGLVVASGDPAPTGGRPSSTFHLATQSRVLIAIDLGATHCAVGIADLLGTVIVDDRRQVDFGDGPALVLRAVWEIAAELLEKIGRAPADVAAVGIGLPGPVQFSTGRPGLPGWPDWQGYDVRGFFTKQVQVPVLVDNDVNIAALGEREASWPGVDDLLYVKVGTGIGAGIISGGSLQRGAEGIAGDIGHVRVCGADRPCRCGNRGCLVAVARPYPLAHELPEAGLPVEDSQGIIDLAAAGNARVLTMLREAGRNIGEILTTCVSLVNPSVIVVGGALSGAGDGLLAGVREVVYQLAVPLVTANLTVVYSRLGGRAALTGAALLASDHVLSSEYIQGQIDGVGRR
ncbi:ROK family protein [Pseudactinotalea sp.]|uniref:ROK family transcriptional regulator n=1 Tax=Pseudactinotalea sp. TaxID=1926260 RepID=UPI003B3A1086